MTADETPTPPLDPYEYPNLRAILDGRVAGDWTEWPMVRVELRKIQQALAWAQEQEMYAKRAASDAGAELAKVREAAQRMVDSYSTHTDRCRVCTINWQSLRGALTSAPSATSVEEKS